ncbi:uncharacterized protein LOC131237460 [Magnolia sinica]|uniref:uncharacterized protein LOC131237460 n=1 Tax=Magnolia sinica TaxID=86752 RepID=UPI00265AEF6C|nr:uncharacterized protein LOC131237460 [Magnolia sinica]
MAIGRWRCRRRRLILLLLLLLCSPVLIPLLCLSSPLLCIVAVCLRGGLKAHVARDQQEGAGGGGSGGGGGGGSGGIGCCEEGSVGPFDGRLLLQRYLEDQLDLVKSIYGCDDSEEDVDDLFP